MDRPWDLLAARTGRAIGEATWCEAMVRHRIVEERWDDVAWFRFEKDVAHLPRGTIVAAEGVIHEYPHLPRIYHLGRGLARCFGAGRFHVEEKIDGYNVRAARIGGRTLAFSRGGYVCPFATDRLADFPEIDRFLAAHPRLVACLELAGPGNPYNREHPPYIRDDVQPFVFDLAEIDGGGFLAPAERAAALEGSGVPTPRSFGWAAGGERGAVAVAEAIERLDREGCEGVVLKAAERGGPRVKYVTLYADAHDLAATAGQLGSIQRAFVVNRLVQAVLSLHELRGGVLDAETARRFGEALLAPMLASVKAVESADPERHPGEVEERYACVLREEANVDRLVRHLERAAANVQIRVLERARRDDGRWRVVLIKRYQKATGFWQSRLIGQTFVD